MDDVYKDAVFPISGDRDNSKGYGSGFVVYRNETHVFILTCFHVLRKICGDEQSIDKERIWVAGKHPTEVFPPEESDIHDLALLQVESIENARPFPLMDSLASEMSVYIPVCQKLTRDFDVEPLQGVVEKENVRMSPYCGCRLDSCKLKMDPDCDLNDGNSGAPVVDAGTDHVVAIVTHDQKKGIVGRAVSIVGLKHIWPDHIWPDMKRDLIKKPTKPRQSSQNTGQPDPYLIDFHPQLEKIRETLVRKRSPGTNAADRCSPMIFFLHGEQDHHLFLTALRDYYWETMIETVPELRLKPRLLWVKDPVPFDKYEAFEAKLKGFLSRQMQNVYRQSSRMPDQQSLDVFELCHKLTFDFPVMVSISARAGDLESHRKIVFDHFLKFWGSFSTAIEKEATAGKYPLSVFLVIKYRHENSAPSFWNILRRPLGSFFKSSKKMDAMETIRQLLTTEEYEPYALPELCGADCDDVDAWMDTDPVIDWMKRKNIVRKEALRNIFSDNFRKRMFIESLAPRLKKEIGLAEA